MTRKPQVLLFVLNFAMLTIFGQTNPETLNIIPQPESVIVNEDSFTIDGLTKIVMLTQDPSAVKVATDFADKINRAKHSNIKVVTEGEIKSRSNEIIFRLSDDDEKYGREGYSLKITPENVIIEAHKANGLFYAVQTIYQLLPYQIFSPDAIGAVSLTLPCVEIFDKPRFTWRGNMLDPSRHFISMDYLKQNLDYLASLKMNKFHWHLTDDQGWRIEIKSYPELTKTGAWRVNKNHINWGDRPEPKPEEIPTYGGYYTQDQIREIIEYAADRFIEVIPEIDMPGHSRSAIASYPEISCDDGKYLVASGGIMSENTYCPGKEITFEFTEGMLNEVMDLFPTEYMHIGGDECNKDKWKTCDHCQKRIKDNDLENEVELQSYFIKRVEKIINARGKKMIGWDEILEGGLAPNATVMSWRGTEGGIVAAKAGHDVIMSPWGYCYLDLRQGDIELEPDYGYGKLLISTAYSFDPVPEGFTEEEAGHILGVQGNLWGESMQKPYDHNYMMFPRLFAIAEVGWTPLSEKDYNDFIRRVEYAFNRLGAMNVNYAPSMYNVAIEHEGSILSSNLYIKLSTEANNKEIHYTIDGTDPDSKSKKYSKPFPVTETVTIKAQAFRDGKAIGRITTKTIRVHKATGKRVHYNIEPSERYSTSDLTLTDCMRGSTEYTKTYWAGFQGTDMDLVIDLGKIEEISDVTASFMHNTRSWIYLPVNVTCEISTDGMNYTEVGKIDYSDKATSPGKELVEAEFKITEQKARYIHLKAIGVKKNPEWHPAPGGSCWIFIDEVIVN